MGYQAKILEDGQVVLPAAFAQDIGVCEGDTLVVQRAGSDFVIRVDSPRASAQERLADVLRDYSIDDFLKGRVADWRE